MRATGCLEFDLRRVALAPPLFPLFAFGKYIKQAAFQPSHDLLQRAQSDALVALLKTMER